MANSRVFSQVGLISGHVSILLLVDIQHLISGPTVLTSLQIELNGCLLDKCDGARASRPNAELVIQRVLLIGRLVVLLVKSERLELLAIEPVLSAVHLLRNRRVKKAAFSRFNKLKCFKFKV